jgi:hypothetical protein
MKLRTMEEIKAIIDDFDENDLERFRSLAPKEMTDERILFIAACTEDDMDDLDWAKLFRACLGLSNHASQLLAVEYSVRGTK